ncbi:DUF3347 domain-containing protein [Rhodohalobacter sp. 8-1]|uniref:DUF3347 domain-containing protein n=1 Tax=Rhodohalobacter sp. 8-1 TaxID=3131972 RepID=UPI0030EB58F1
MKALTFSAILLLMTALTACSGSTDENQADTGEQNVSNQQQAQIQQQESQIPYNFRLEMETLLEHYFDLKNAVVTSEMPAAKEAAKELSAYTTEVMDEVLEAENQGLWLGIARIIRTESDKLISTDSLEDMRIYFEHISRTVIRIADSFDPAGDPYYLMECDEAAIGEGQWLSRDEEIRNPYQTSADVSCGEILEEF